MATEIGRELAALRRLTPAQLREKYAAVFGEATVTKNRTWLVRRIAWRLQVLAEGDLSQRAQDRAAELAHDADLRVIPPREKVTVAAVEPAARGGTKTGTLAEPRGDDRLPPPGSVLTHKYKGGSVQVKVLADGFEYAGQVYGSLRNDVLVEFDRLSRSLLDFARTMSRREQRRAALLPTAKPNLSPLFCSGYSPRTREKCGRRSRVRPRHPAFRRVKDGDGACESWLHTHHS